MHFYYSDSTIKRGIACFRYNIAGHLAEEEILNGEHPLTKKLTTALIIKKISITVFAAFMITMLFSAGTWAYEKEFVMVPMRDGVKLATDIYLPSNNNKKLPVILMRTPYGREMGAIFATQVLSKRYAWVVQDTRGRFDSEGTSMSFMDDTDDGRDTIDWIGKQKWCNGKVGTTGISAMGITQYAMAADPSPYLKSQYVMAAAGSLYHDAAHEGGGFRRALVLKWVGGNDFPIKILKLLLSTQHYIDLWKKNNIHEHLENIHYPILHMGGWYDIFLEGNIRAFQDIQENGAEGARGRQRLVVGPWTHGGWCGMAGTKQGQLTYPVNSKYNLIKKMMNWFDETLKGKDKGYFSGPAVRYYVMGDVDDENAPGNSWRSADTWPPKNSMPTSYYFHNDGTLSTEKPAADDDVMKIVSDPANPVPTVGGANLSLPAGSFDQRKIEKRDDVLVFTTPALTKPLDVTGDLRAIVYFSTDVPDTDIAVRLMDVYPDGRSMLVADGLVRAIHRNGMDGPAPPLEKGKIYEMEVNVTATSLIFNKGHRVRVSLAGSNFPRFDINLHNGKFLDLQEGELEKAVKENIGRYVSKPDLAVDTRPANITFYVDAEHPSHFLLPLYE